jgi:hypothetical protein
LNGVNDGKIKEQFQVGGGLNLNMILRRFGMFPRGLGRLGRGRVAHAVANLMSSAGAKSC